MAERTAVLWCKVLGRLVEVTLTPAAPGAAASPGVPDGWRVSECRDRGQECYGHDCPFTSDTPSSPFGEVGELPDLPPERVDPTAHPSFEGEWS